MSTTIEDMIKECGCNNCRDMRMCNGTDLMNCYAKKRLTIKGNTNNSKQTNEVKKK